MIQLIYISTAVGAISDAEIDEILRVSRSNNNRANITGLLLYDGKRFLQAIEGPTSAVDAAYDKIKSDGRHKALVLLSSKHIEERAFGQWSMAAERVKPAEAADLAETIDLLTADMQDLTAQATFRGFARIRR